MHIPFDCRQPASQPTTLRVPSCQRYRLLAYGLPGPTHRRPTCCYQLEPGLPLPHWHTRLSAPWHVRARHDAVCPTAPLGMAWHGMAWWPGSAAPVSAAQAVPVVSGHFACFPAILPTIPCHVIAMHALASHHGSSSAFSLACNALVLPVHERIARRVCLAHLSLIHI